MELNNLIITKFNPILYDIMTYYLWVELSDNQIVQPVKSTEMWVELFGYQKVQPYVHMTF